MVGRPRKDAPLGDAERSRASRARRGVRAVELPAAVMEALVAIRQRDGDSSLTAAACRVILAAARAPRSRS